MKFLSIDIETTGLDEEWCQILEIGAVLGDLTDTSVSDLPWFQCRLYYDRVVGQPYALKLNAELIGDMDRRDSGFNYLHKDSVGSALCIWLEQHIPNFWGTKVTVAGKNYGSFDRRFLAKIPRWPSERFHHRYLDPGNLFWIPESDEVLPDTKECIRRAGLSWDPKKLHSAVWDARLVVELVRAGSKFRGKE